MIPRRENGMLYLLFLCLGLFFWILLTCRVSGWNPVGLAALEIDLLTDFCHEVCILGVELCEGHLDAPTLDQAAS